MHEPTEAIRDDDGVYAISVAARLVSMEIQNLRVYERHGLVSPDRTSGGARLYSADDLVRLRRVKQLLAQGLNLAAIVVIIDLQDEVTALKEELARRTS